VEFTYRPSTNEYCITTEHAGQKIIIGKISDNSIQFNENILLPDFSLKKKDIRQLLNFIAHPRKIKLCDAKDCQSKFIPKKSHQRFCCSQCRARTHAHAKRGKQNFVSI